MSAWKTAVVALVLAASGAVAWRGALVPWREDRHWRYAARTGLRSLAELEQAYCFHAGRYTDDFLLLATMAPSPREVAEMREEAFLTGSLRIEVLGDRVRLTANARDRRRTPLSFEARKPQREGSRG